MKIAFDGEFIEFAKKHGVNSAIFTACLEENLFHNLSTCQGAYNDRVWVKGSIEEFAKYFEFWTTAQIRQIIDKLKKAGVLLTGNFNENKLDKTMWYTIDFKVAGLSGCRPFYKNKRW